MSSSVPARRSRSPWTRSVVLLVAACAIVPALVGVLIGGILAGFIVLVAAAAFGTGVVLVVAALWPHDDATDDAR